VAKALLARDGIPLEIGYALWAFYVRRLIHYIKKYPSVLVRFDVEKESLLDQIADVCNRTGLDADKGIISSWYDSKLVRSATIADDSSPMFRRVAPLWEELVSLHARSRGES
jgi:hypothetical protein